MLPMVALMLINFVRTLVVAAGFATYLGLPLQHGADFRLVQVFSSPKIKMGYRPCNMVRIFVWCRCTVSAHCLLVCL